MQSLANSYPHIAASVAESMEKDTAVTADSLHGSQESILSRTEFSFDRELINTRVYREVLGRASAKLGRVGLTETSASETAATQNSTVRGVSTCPAPDQRVGGPPSTIEAAEGPPQHHVQEMPRPFPMHLRYN